MMYNNFTIVNLEAKKFDTAHGGPIPLHQFQDNNSTITNF